MALDSEIADRPTLVGAWAEVVVLPGASESRLELPFPPAR